jgi:hypothetical protein
VYNPIFGYNKCKNAKETMSRYLPLPAGTVGAALSGWRGQKVPIKEDDVAGN